jgi:hypothetical protein
MTQQQTSSLTLDRPHQFKLGDVVRPHDAEADDEGSWFDVTELTLRVRGEVAYPTYTLTPYDVTDDGDAQDVLCTADLVIVIEADDGEEHN